MKRNKQCRLRNWYFVYSVFQFQNLLIFFWKSDGTLNKRRALLNCQTSWKCHTQNSSSRWLAHCSLKCLNLRKAISSYDKLLAWEEEKTADKKENIPSQSSYCVANENNYLCLVSFAVPRNDTLLVDGRNIINHAEWTRKTFLCLSKCYSGWEIQIDPFIKFSFL